MTLSPSGVPSRADIQDAIDDAVAVLAARSQAGSGTITTTAAGTESLVVTFATPFAAAPKVVAGLATSVDPSLLRITVSSVTASGFTANIYRVSGSGGVSFHWIAQAVS